MGQALCLAQGMQWRVLLLNNDTIYCILIKTELTAPWKLHNIMYLQQERDMQELCLLFQIF